MDQRGRRGQVQYLPTSALPLSLDEFNELVLPELRRRRTFRSESEGRTLRDNLDLPMPSDRYSPSEGA